MGEPSSAASPPLPSGRMPNAGIQNAHRLPPVSRLGRRVLEAQIKILSTDRRTLQDSRAQSNQQVANPQWFNAASQRAQRA